MAADMLINEIENLNQNQVNIQDEFPISANHPSHKIKLSKSNEKYIYKPVVVNSSQQPGSNQIKIARYESISQKITNKMSDTSKGKIGVQRRIQQPPQLVLKENTYQNDFNLQSDVNNHIENQFNKTAINVISEKHFIDLRQNSSNIDTSHFLPNQTLKFADAKHQNFDFGVTQPKVPSSTKNSSSSKKPQNQGKTAHLSQNSNFFSSNTNLQNYISNQPNQNKTPVSNTMNQTQQQNLSTRNQSGSTKRKGSNNAGSKKNIVPVLDVKKVQIKQIQNMINKKALSIRGDKDQNQTKQQISDEQQQMMQNIGDSALYKNLTQKLIKEQQQQMQMLIQVQQPLKQSFNQPVQPGSASNKINMLKKQLQLSQIQRDELSISQPIVQHPSSKPQREGIGAQVSKIISSTTNKTQKTFNFDLTMNTSNNRKSNGGNYKSNNPKKMLNLTGTLPKGLLSPTNNADKHKHAEYFESATTLENHLENTAPITFGTKQASSVRNANNPTTITSNTSNHHGLGGTVININIENSGACAHNPFGSSQSLVYPFIHGSNQQSLIGNHHMIPTLSQASNTYHPHLNFHHVHSDLSGKINSHQNQQRVQSKSPSQSDNNLSSCEIGVNISGKGENSNSGQKYSKKKKQPNSSRKNSAQNSKKNIHHKNTTTVQIPAQLVLNEILGKKINTVASSKVQSMKQTPRAVKGKSILQNNQQIDGKSDSNNPTSKSSNYTKRNIQKINSMSNMDEQHLVQHQQQMMMQIMSNTGVINLDQVTKNGQLDFSDIEIGFEVDKQNMKLRTQKLNNVLKEVALEQTKHKSNHSQKFPLQLQQIQNTQQNQVNNQLSPKTAKIQQQFILQQQQQQIQQQFQQKELKQKQQQQQMIAQQFFSQQPKDQSEVTTSSFPNSSKLSDVNSSSRTSSINESQVQCEDIQFPLTPARALKLFMNYMTDFEKGEILDYKQIYFLGLNAKKIKGSPANQFNYGYDDDRGDYKVVLKDHIAYRFEVLEFLGKGSFGQALKCLDHKTNELVAVKLIRNKKRFQHQAGVELKILQHLKNADPDDAFNIIRIKDYVIFRKHLVISFELFSINLYEFIKNNNFQGVSLSLIRRFAIQILQALKFIKDQNVIHCDLKPENILLKSPDKSGIKIIDFGSSCFIDERIYTYIQSRFYRAPEIILGIPYTTAIDMWSFGCILTELFTGFPIFPGESEQEQLALIMEVRGYPPQNVLESSTRMKLFFDMETSEPLPVYNSRGKLRQANTKPLDQIMRCNSETFLDFINRCLDWNPQTRMTPFEALQHDWIIEGLPPKVLLHHQRMLGIIPNNDQSYQHLKAVPSQRKNNVNYKSVPPKIKSLNNTCLLSDALKQDGDQAILKGKRDKSLLNKTGVVVMDDDEDLVDVEHAPQFGSGYFTNQAKEAQNYKIKNIDQENDHKSKTANMADLIHEINKKHSHKAKLETSQQLKGIGNKMSFFSQNEQEYYFNEDGDEDMIDTEMLPYDERDQQQYAQNQQQQNQNKKNKIPFSFLMHHYLKTNGGQKQVAQKDPQVGFFKPKADVKMNNFISNNGNGKSNQNGFNQKKAINMSSNI